VAACAGRRVSGHERVAVRADPHAGTAAEQRRAVQVDPIKLKLKLPGTKRLKRKCIESLSNFAFTSKLRRYNKVFVVGDVDQAIYGWRGAEVANIRTRFDADFNGRGGAR